jgi:hypothetical protein
MSEGNPTSDNTIVQHDAGYDPIDELLGKDVLKIEKEVKAYLRKALEREYGVKISPSKFESLYDKAIQQVAKRRFATPFPPNLDDLPF